MSAIVVSATAGDANSVAVRATDWVAAFYPDVTVSSDGAGVELSAPARDESELRLIWLTSLANERLLMAGAAARAAVLDELTR